jgi:decaprenylphospho-beta-D-erythro-pentofuranosid-2-ulose 2-reductase
MNGTEGTLLVVGGTSDIGHAIAMRFGQAGWSIQLAGRDADGLARNARDIETRTRANVSIHLLDILDCATFSDFSSGLGRLPDVAVCTVGLLGDQHTAESDQAHAQLVMRTNYEGPALLLSMLAKQFAARGSGTIVGVSSVAGDRGRASNYFYGSAKAGFSAYLSGLRNQLCKRNVRVITVKPGFVITRMTAGLDLPGALTAQPDEVGAAVFRAVQKESSVIYVRPIWRLIMAVICAIPERLFQRLPL